MPRVSPFRALVYAPERPGSSDVSARIRIPGEAPWPGATIVDLTDRACPPYDVIDEAMRTELLARDPHNAVRLELSPEADPHAAATATLARWRADGTLVLRDTPELFVYAHARPPAPDRPTVRGVMARVLLEPYGDDVRAHEHTMAAPREDRLGLLHSTQVQLSPILAIYFDRGADDERVTDDAWTDAWRARDGDGLLHQLAAIEADEGLATYLSGQRLFIADGHHRYETALAYQAEIRRDPRFASAPPGSLAADWTLMVLVNAEREAVEIRATHRLLRGVDPARIAALPAELGPLFEVVPVAGEELGQRLAALGGAPGPVFGFVVRDGAGSGGADGALDGRLLIGQAEAIAERMGREPVSPEVQELDLAALHAIVLRDALRLDPDRGAGERILYTKDPADAVARVRSGDAQAALLVRPTRLDQLAAVATAGDVMPEKSTYFYPKLLTGMAFYPVEDG